jgi:hypothetical protein
VYQGDNPVLQLFNTREDKDPFQELPLQACYSVSDIGNNGNQYFVVIKLASLITLLVESAEKEGTLSEIHTLNDHEVACISFKYCLIIILFLTEI